MSQGLVVLEQGMNLGRRTTKTYFGALVLLSIELPEAQKKVFGRWHALGGAKMRGRP